jgi:N-acetylglucosamine PTS system EIICBA or EIICB component
LPRRPLPGSGQTIMHKRFSQFASMMLLPLSCLALAGLAMVLADLLDRLAVPYAGILLQAGLMVFRSAPLLVAVSIANGLIVHEKGLAVIAAALSSLTWTATAAAVVEARSPAGILPAYDLGWLTGLAVGLMTYGVFHFTERKIRSRTLARFVNPHTLVVWQLPLAVAGGVLSGLIWLLAAQGLARVAQWIWQSGDAGLFVYGLLNRLLLPFGLHHVVDHALWQLAGDYTTQGGILVQGDLGRFLAGDPTAGRFTAGFFPVMMLVIPAALAAAWLAGRIAERSRTWLLPAAAASAALLGGITEAADFLILFISPFLYLFYALLTGLSMVLSSQLQVLHGFTFSAGLLDYTAFWSMATRPVWLLAIGAVLGALAFAVFFLIMKRFAWTVPLAGLEQAGMIRTSTLHEEPVP